MKKNRLNLIYKVVSEHIHDNAWSDKDIERLSKLTPLEIIGEMKDVMYRLSECPCCSMQGVGTDIKHNQCLFVELLKEEE